MKIQCPATGCGVEIEEDDFLAQKAHMEAHHPNIIDDRMRQSGYLKLPNGEWFDAWASE